MSVTMVNGLLFLAFTTIVILVGIYVRAQRLKIEAAERRRLESDCIQVGLSNNEGVIRLSNPPEAHDAMVTIYPGWWADVHVNDEGTLVVNLDSKGRRIVDEYQAGVIKPKAAGDIEP